MTEKQKLDILTVLKQGKLRRIFDEDDDRNLLTDDALTSMAKPNSTLWELRVRLWSLVEDREAKFEAFGQCEDITIQNVTSGICSRSRFDQITDDPFKCAFLSRPIRSYANNAEDLTKAAQTRIWEILSLPIKDADGNPDKSLTKIVFDTAKMVLDRNLGQAIQRTETYARIQSHQVNVTTQEKSVELIDAKIAQLEQALGHTDGTPVETAETGSPTSKAGAKEKVPMAN